MYYFPVMAVFFSSQYYSLLCHMIPQKSFSYPDLVFIF